MLRSQAALYPRLSAKGAAVSAANTYYGLHARYYDEFYSEKPYADEARFVDAQLVAKVGRRGELLDVA